MGKLGYSSITLTDLTEMLPVSLVLESSLPQNIQTKIGSLYTPDLSKDGEELIITPSLFIGTEEVKTIPVKKSEEQDSNYIYYQTGDIGENGAEINYVDSSTKKDGIWVDDEGKLHYNKNLNRNITIEARINNFKNEKHNDPIALVKTTNPINILFLEEGNNNYNVVITSSGGREHFEEENASPITLTAKLYHGTTPITEGISYKWDIVTDKDTEEKDDDLDWSEDKIGTDFVSIEPSIIVERNKVSSVEVFSCTITVNKTGLSYTGTKILRDFTDGYTNQLIADKSLILTPNNTTVTLTNQVWHQANIINKDKYEGSNLTEEQIKENESNHNRFFYKWSLLTKDMEEIILFLGSGKEYKDYTVDLNSSFQKLDETGKVLVDDETGKPIEGNFPKENFSILGMVTIDGKTVTLNYADIKYQPVTYTVNISPKIVFVPATNSGTYRGEGDFIQKIKFQLLDDNKQPLAYDVNSSDQPSLINNNDNSSIKITKKDSSIWDFDIEFTLDTKSSNNLWGDIVSKTYEFTYEYLGNIFTEEFEVIKNYSGEQGFSGYTIDLSNEFHVFSGGEGQADSNQSTSCSVSAYFGIDKKEIKKISVNNDLIIYEKNNGDDKEDIEYSFGKNNSSLFFSTSPGNEGSIDINIRTNNSEIENEKSSFLKDVEPISFYITIRDDNILEEKDITFFKTFSYTINYNGKTYRLNINPTNIKYSEVSGEYDPSSIEVSALMRGENGEATFYEKGKIIYSFNEKDWSYLGNRGSITGYRGLEKIHIRLYGGQASIFEGNIDLENNEKYLLDRETIPILISLEGYEIGGENLLKWTKTIPIEPNKWRSSGDQHLTIEKDGDFSIMNFNTIKEGEDDKWYCFVSPKISLTSDMIGKQYCLSFLFYGENLENFNNKNHFSFELASFKEFDSIARDAFGTIGYIGGNKENSDYLSSEELENSKWCRIYKTFTLDKDFFNRSDNKIDTNEDGILDKEVVTPLEECKYLSVYFFLKNEGKVKIKKPKLEMGNIVSAWSENPEDIFYDTFEEQNLISNSYEFILKYESTLVSSNLLPDTNYALSWQSVDSIAGKSLSEKITYGFYDINQNEITLNNALSYGKIELSSQQSNAKNIILHSPENLKSLKLYFFIAEKDFINGSETDLSSYNGTEILFSKIKLEKGSVSTNYTISDSQWEKINEALKQSTNQNSIDIQTAKGDIITIQQEDLPNFLEQLNKTQTNIEDGFTQINTSLTTMNSTLGAKIVEVESLFKVVTDLEQGGPYIELLVKQPENGTTNQNFQMRLTNTKLGFYSSDNIKNPENGEDFFSANALAYFSKDKLFIKQADILDTIRIGREENGGFLVITTTFTDGITFTWENQ